MRPACLDDTRVRCRYVDGAGCPCQDPDSTLGETVDVIRDLADYQPGEPK
jgi:hypothetical protein